MSTIEKTIKKNDVKIIPCEFGYDILLKVNRSTPLNEIAILLNYCYQKYDVIYCVSITHTYKEKTRKERHTYKLSSLPF